MGETHLSSAYVCTYVCSCLSFKRFILLKHRSVKSCFHLPALHECEHMDFSEAVAIQDSGAERKIRPLISFKENNDAFLLYYCLQHKGGTGFLRSAIFDILL